MLLTRSHLSALGVALLLLAGCVSPPQVSGLSRPSATVGSTATTRSTTIRVSPAVLTATVTPAPTPTATATPEPTVTPAPTATVAATATTTAAPSPAAAEQAIKAVIQRANEEQTAAFAQHDATLMRDTATSDYFDQLVQTNRGLANSGVGAIKLLGLEWGPITVQGGTTAQATTFETWQTTWVDGTVEQDRERNVYTVVRQGDAWLIQADDHPDANAAAPGPSSPGTAPAPAPALVGPGESHNWSGYAATGGTFTAIKGTWTVPQVASSAAFTSDATWVGIGGVRTRDLIQAGTEAMVSRSGTVVYHAWIERLPQTSRVVPLTVSPGDAVTVSLAEQTPGSWLIVLKDDTTGQSYQTTEQYDSSQTSAEWVEEAPSGRRQLLPLDNFQSVQFRNGSAVKDGATVTIGRSGAQAITMIDWYGQRVAVPSKLSSDGSGFTVTRVNASPTPSPVASPPTGTVPRPTVPRGRTAAGLP